MELTPTLSREDELRAADRLRDADSDSVDRALACYLRHADAIDPATREGVERVGWIIRLGRRLDPAAEDLLRRAAAHACDDGVREAAEVMLFQFPFRRGDHAAAEAHLRKLLRRHRKTGSLREIGVVNDLALVYQAACREFEVLVLARRASRLAVERSYTLGSGIAFARLAWALERLGEWDELERGADHLANLLPDLDLGHHPPAKRCIHAARRAVRAARGEFDAARYEHALVVAAGPALTGDVDDAFDGALLEARIALASHLPASAANIAEHAGDRCAAGTRNWFRATTLLARALAAVGDLGGAVRTAAPVLHALHSADARRLGPSGLLSFTAAMCEALGDDPAATPFHAASSELLLARISEIQGCVAEIEELSDAAEEDRAILARHRTHFVIEQRLALQAIARIHDESHGAERPEQLERLTEDGRLRICAWCLTMRNAIGRVLPIGHLIPGSIRLGVTHGICDDCRARVPI